MSPFAFPVFSRTKRLTVFSSLLMGSLQLSYLSLTELFVRKPEKNIYTNTHTDTHRRTHTHTHTHTLLFVLFFSTTIWEPKRKQTKTSLYELICLFLTTQAVKHKPYQTFVAIILGIIVFTDKKTQPVNGVGTCVFTRDLLIVHPFCCVFFSFSENVRLFFLQRKCAAYEYTRAEEDIKMRAGVTGLQGRDRSQVIVHAMNWEGVDKQARTPCHPQDVNGQE
jgi:hypothetical protein